MNCRTLLLRGLPAAISYFSCRQKFRAIRRHERHLRRIQYQHGQLYLVVYYASAPKAAANFIGLATGKKAWLDLPSGLVRTNPFYNGLIFHRVVTNFVIQAGSPNGLGTDGPGYAFVDETTNRL